MDLGTNPSNQASNTQGTMPDPYATNPQPSGVSKPMIAGILLILAGLLGLFTWLSVLTVPSSAIDQALTGQVLTGYENLEITAEMIQSILLVCGAIGCIFSILALLGGIVSLKRKLWPLALLGSILGLFTVGPMLVSSVLSLVALILLILARKEFNPVSS